MRKIFKFPLSLISDKPALPRKTNFFILIFYLFRVKTQTTLRRYLHNENQNLNSNFSLALLVGCSQTEKEIVTESQSQTKTSETTTQIEETTSVFEDETVCTTQIKNQNQGLKAETKTSENSKEKVVPSTKESTTRLENITELKDDLPPTTTQTITTEPITEPTTAKQFDINYYVNFAKSYALSLGFRLDSTATACWDNPIAAGPTCIYTERDIKNYLNTYSRMDDVTDIWIWPEHVNDNEYLIYIGYA